jgi:predicted MFS family arabinose efflux permease
MMQVSDEKNRTLMFSLQTGLITLSSAVGKFLAGALPGLFGIWLGMPLKSAAVYQAVIVASVLSAALVVVPFLIMQDPPRKHSPAAWNWHTLTVARVLARPLTLKLATPNLLIGLGAALLIPYLNVFYVDRFQVSDQMLGSIFGLLAILTGLGSLLVPRLARGLGSKIRTVVVVQSTSVLFLALIGVAPVLWLSVSGLLLRGTLMNMANPLWSAFSMEQTPEQERGTVNSVQNIAWSLGWAIGPYISGIVQERYGFNPLFIATSLLYTAAIGLTWLMFRDHEEKRQSQTVTEAI